MVLSKSFGYAIRGILFVASKQHESRKISIEEIAGSLHIPKHFLAKVMKLMVKSGMVGSTRGQQGGFYLNDKTLHFTLADLIVLIEGPQYFNSCLLGRGKCNPAQPCPLHHKVAHFQSDLLALYRQTTIGDLLTNDQQAMIESLATAPALPLN